MSNTFLQFIDALELKRWIHDDHELALLDVREHGQYGEDHLFFAVSLPYSVLELDIERLVPLKNTRIVLYADESSSAVAISAAKALIGLGYSQVFALQGGIEAWKKAGYATFAGVNLPSKTFGEIAEHLYHTPSLRAMQLHAMLEDGKTDVIVLDGRPIEEYRKMNIPGAICCPNGELALRIGQLAPDPATTIVINCAGRTRSIIGAQTLINLNIPNPVYALENGTQGWFLADLPLEHGSDRLYPTEIADDSRSIARQRATQLLQKHGIETVDASRVASWLQGGAHNVFLCDIRTQEEFKVDGHPAAQHTPGGQLIQATDHYVGVRKSRIVICDFDGIRAPVVASWLKQLGWNAYILKDPHGLPQESVTSPTIPALRHTEVLHPDDLAPYLDGPGSMAVVLDTRPSQEYRKAHLAVARWATRPSLLAELDAGAGGKTVGDRNAPVLLLGTAIGKLRLLAHDLEAAGYMQVRVCVLGETDLRRSGLPMASTPDDPPDSACIDYLFFVHDRHDGNKAAARKYLEWETNLVSQIDEQERNTFSIQA